MLVDSRFLKMSLMLMLLFSSLHSIHLPSLAESKTPLHIGCISPMSGKHAWWGLGISVAAEMAFKMINNNTNILRDYELILLKNDSRGQTGRGNNILFDYLTTRKIVMVLGPARSNVAMSFADTAKYWKLVQISASATSGDLSDHRQYPYFQRTVPSLSTMSASFVTLAKKFGWHRVSILYYNRDMQVEAASVLKSEFKKNNITVLSYGSYSNAEDASTQLKHIKDIDSRIIFGFLQRTTSVMCKAFEKKVFGRQYAWVIQTPDQNGWWNRTFSSLDCSIPEISEAAQHVITINDMPLGKEDVPGISGMTPSEFLTRYNQYARDHGTMTSADYGTFAFDAAWMMAIALNKTLKNISPFRSVDERSYYGNRPFALALRGNIRRTMFMGVSGFVHLDSNGDRYGHFRIQQIQENELRVVGFHDVYAKKVELQPGTNFTWKGGHPPSDQLIVCPRLVVFSREGFIVVCCLAAFGILLSSLFLYCNVAYRHKKFIKMSSPNINNLIIAGCLLAYVSVILFAVDGNHLNSVICQVRVFTISIGFTMAFGAMFSKTWRVHRITRKLRMKQRRIKDIHLLGMVMTFLVFDIIILVTLTVFNPITKDFRSWLDSRPKGHTSADVIYKKEIAFCRTNNTILWLVIVYGTKTLLLVFGLFLAWETRKVKINALNDSQHTGMAVYNVVVTCFIGVPILKLLGDNLYEVSVIITTCCIMSCTTVTLCLVFVPKVRRILNSTADELSIKDNISMKTHVDSCRRPSCGCNCHIQNRISTAPVILNNYTKKEACATKKSNCPIDQNTAKL